MTVSLLLLNTVQSLAQSKDLDNATYTYDAVSKTASLVKFKNNTLKEFKIPSSININGNDFEVTVIGDSSFINNQNLDSVYIPNTVKTIGKRAFYNSMIKKASMGTSVKSIEDEAFCFCTNLKTINLPYSLTRIAFNAFASTLKLEAITFPESLTYIGSGAFQYSGLRTLLIPSNVKYIGGSAFDSNTKLDSVIIKSDVDIMPSTFSTCRSLTSVKIEGNIKNISYGAFQDAENLEKLSLPKTLTKIDKYAFSYCKKLRTIYSYSEEPWAADSLAFHESCYLGCTLYVPKGSLSKYLVSRLSKNFNIVEMNNETDGINEVKNKDVSFNCSSVGTICIHNVIKGGTVYIYTIDGNMIKKENIIGCSTSINSLKRGVYIVKLNNKSYKVYIK